MIRLSRQWRFGRIVAMLAVLVHLLSGLPLALAAGDLHRTVICTPEGRIEIVIDLTTGKPVETKSEAPCKHCGACTAGDLPKVGMLHSAAPTLATTRWPEPRANTDANSRHGLHLARAPPASEHRSH